MPGLDLRVADGALTCGAQEIDDSIARHMARLWADPGLKYTYECRALYQLEDSCAFFLDKVEELGRDGYLPSYEDVLRCRARTTGIVETQFVLMGNRFRMVDVGGQRNERKKWFHWYATSPPRARCWLVPS